MTSLHRTSLLTIIGFLFQNTLFAQELYYSGKLDSARTLCELLSVSVYNSHGQSSTIEYGVSLNGKQILKGEKEVKLKSGLNDECLNNGWTDAAFESFLKSDSILPSGQYQVWAKTPLIPKLLFKTFTVHEPTFPFEKLQLHVEKASQLSFNISGTDSSDLFVFKSAKGKIDSIKGPQMALLGKKGWRSINLEHYRYGFLLSDTVMSKARFLSQLSKKQFEPKVAIQKGVGQVTQKLPSKAKPITIGANIVYETQMSDLDTIYPELPNNYHRVFARPSIGVFGIPFSSELYYTTETGYGYNLNSFNLSFDKSQWEQNLRTDFDRKFNELNSISSSYDQRLKEIDNELEELTKERNRLSETVEDPERQQQLASGMKQKTQSTVSDSLNLITNRLNDSLQVRTDSLHGQLDSNDVLKNRDKLISYQNRVSERHDQLMMEKERVSSKLKACEEKKEELEQGWSSKDSMVSDQKDKYLSKINGLELGLHTPLYSRAVMRGTPVSGVSFNGKHKNIYFQSTHGKYTDTNYRVLTNQPANFHNTFSALKAGIKNDDGYFVEAGLYRFLVPEKPLAYTTGMAAGVKQGSLELKAETHTFLPDKEKMTVAASNAQMRFHVGYKLPIGAMQLSAQYERVGAHYQAPAQPFFRNNLQRVETRVSKEFYKGSVQTSVFVRNEKPIDDNGLPYNYTGMGAELNAVLPNGFTLGGSYTPFQQSISLLHQQVQQQTQFSVINGYAQHAFMVWQSQHRTGLQIMAMQYVFQEEAPKWFKQYSVNHEVKFPYPIKMQGQLNFLNNEVQGEEEPVFALTGSTQITFQQKKWAATGGYNKNLNYLDNSGYEAITVGFNFQPFSRVDLQLTYSRRKFENWPFVGNQSENVLNLMAAVSL